MGLGFCKPPGVEKIGCFLFLYVTFLNDNDCDREIAIELFELRNDVDDVARWGKIFSCALHSILSLRRWVAPPQNDEIENSVKIWSLSPLEGDRITRSRQNLMCKRRPRAYSS